MATFDSWATVKRMIEGDGWLPECGDRDAPDNPPAIKVVEYTNAAGRQTWGVVFRGERNPDRYEIETEYVSGPKVIWRCEAEGA